MIGQEIFDGVTSLAGMLRFDRGFAALLPRDRVGCARSFVAYALAAPALLIYLDIDIATGLRDAADAVPAIPADIASVASISILSQIIQIAGFPILLRVLLRAYGQLDRWAWLVSANNWLNAGGLVIGLAAWLMVAPLFQGDAQAGARYFGIALQLYFLVVEAFMAETVLQVGGVAALGVVLLDYLFGHLVDATGHWIVTGSFLNF